MPMTDEHNAKRILKREQVEERERWPFKKIMEEPVIARAEVLNALTRQGAMVAMRAQQPDPIRFAFRTEVDAEAFDANYTIPGEGSPPAIYPVFVAVYVASHLDYPMFGGRYVREMAPRIDGTTPLETVEAQPDLIQFEVLLGGAMPRVLLAPAIALPSDPEPALVGAGRSGGRSGSR